MTDLKMQNKDGVAETLPAGDRVIKTGVMGDCVCAIVMWGPQFGRYQYMRGFHGSGGIGAVNWESLFAGVDNRPTTRVYIITGPLNIEDGGTLESGKHEARAKAPNASFVIVHGLSSASINRQGVFEECCPRGLRRVAVRPSETEYESRSRSRMNRNDVLTLIAEVESVLAFPR